MIPRRSVSLVTLALALLVGASACGRYVNAYAAVVNGTTISFDQLERAVVAARGTQQGSQEQQGPAPIELQRQVLLQLIQRELVSQLLVRYEIAVSDADVEARARQVRALFATEQEFAAALQSQNLDAAKLRDRLRDQLRIERLQLRVAPVTVTDAEIAAEYAKRVAEFTQVHARHILFSTQSRTAAVALAAARDALSRIRGGEDFAAVARRLSDDPGSKDKGGDLGTQPAAGYVPEFAKAVRTLPLKRVSDPVKTELGYHLVEVLSRTTKPLSDVREQLRNELFQGKVREPFQRFVQQAVTTSTIEVNPRLGDLDPSSFSIVDHRFFLPSSPEPEPQVPGLSPPRDGGVAPIPGGAPQPG